MRFKVFLSSAIATLFLSTVAVGQDAGNFGGHGIRQPESQTPAASNSKWPNLLNFSKNQETPRNSNPFSGIFSRKPGVPKQGFEMFKSNNSGKPGSSEKLSPFAGFSALFPKRDPDKPNIFEQMNAKSRDLFERSNHWTRRRSQSLKDRTFGTWDDISRDMREIQKRQNATIPAQPPIRTAQETDQPHVRF